MRRRRLEPPKRGIRFAGYRDTQEDCGPRVRFVATLTQVMGVAPTSEDMLTCIHAVLYAPSYRRRYGDFLKRDFPRVPLTTNRERFAKFIAIGHELIALHTMQQTLPRITGYPVAGSNEVVKV